MPEINHPEYYIRQTGLINPADLNMPVQIVGAGSIGSWTALALLKLGCQNVGVLDFDDVEEQNVGSQIYSGYDIGKRKVEALRDKLSQLVDTRIHFSPTEVKEDVNIPKEGIVISAVDNMETREFLFKYLKGSKVIYIDGRMAGNNIQVFTTPMNDKKRVAFYNSTLFSSDHAIPVPCSERSVVYNCFIISGLIADFVAQIANGKIPPEEIILDLANLTMFGGLA